MSESQAAADVKDHFERTWNRLIDAVGKFPEDQWRQAEDQRMQPARIAYHLLQGSERYSWADDSEKYVACRTYNLNWEEAPCQQFPCLADCLQAFQDMKARTLCWVDKLGDDGLINRRPTWPWTGSKALGQAVYNLRHLQHHLAELNVELRRRGLPTADGRTSQWFGTQEC